MDPCPYKKLLKSQQQQPTSSSSHQNGSGNCPYKGISAYRSVNASRLNNFFSNRIQEIRRAHAIVGAFMKAQVAARKSELQALADAGCEDDSERKDVLSMLVRAIGTEAKLRLDDDELVSTHTHLFF
jgi:cytochrome P450